MMQLADKNKNAGIWFGFLLLSLWMGFTLPVGAQTTDTLFLRSSFDGEKDRNIGRQALFFLDNEQALTYDSVATLPNSVFKRSDSEVLSLGFVSGQAWVRILLKNEDHPSYSWILQIGDPNIDEVEFFAEYPDGSVDRVTTGGQMPIALRSVKHRFFVFPVRMLQREPVSIHLKLKSSINLVAPLRLMPTLDFAMMEYFGQFRWGIFYGILFVMILYNLFIFFSLRDITYLYYVGRTLAFALMLSSINGLAFQFVWPNHPEWNQYALVFFMNLLTGVTILFGRSFLKTSVYVPRLDKAFLYCGGLVLVLLVLSFISPSISLQAGGLLAIIVIFVIFAAAIIDVRAGFRPAVFYLIAESLLLIGAFLKVLAALSVLPSNFYTEYGLHIGVALEAVLLSLGLADRITILKKERMDAQQRFEKEQLERRQEETAHKLELQRQETAKKEAELRAKASEMQAQLIEAENQRKTEELEQARDFQTNMLPQEMPKCKHLEVAAYQETATEVGGDYYDFIKNTDDEFVGVIGDATGHGLPASLMVAVTKSAIFSMTELTPDEMVHQLNATITGMKMSRRVNMAALVYYIRQTKTKGKYKLTLVGGGIPPLYVLRKEGGIDEYTREFLPLGIFAGATYESLDVEIYSGDLLLFCSDGIPERLNAITEYFGYERLGESLKRIHEMNKTQGVNAQQIIDELMQDVNDYADEVPPDDDLTAVAIKVLN